jgi:hypothetical protein
MNVHETPIVCTAHLRQVDVDGVLRIEGVETGTQEYVQARLNEMMSTEFTGDRIEITWTVRATHE